VLVPLGEGWRKLKIGLKVSEREKRAKTFFGIRQVYVSKPSLASHFLIKIGIEKIT